MCDDAQESILETEYITTVLLVLLERTGRKAKIKARNERMKSLKLGKISGVN